MRRIALVSSSPSVIERLSGDFDTHVLSAETPLRIDGYWHPDAYVVDVADGDRSALVERLASAVDCPIVVLGADDDPELACVYLEAGADACVPLSAPPEEWSARIRAVTRYRRPADPYEAEADYRAGDVSIARDSRRVLVRGDEVRLTRTEFNLLLVLAERLDQVVPHRKLMAEVWGPEYLSARHYLRVYVRRLREKLEVDPEHPLLLVAERGQGYMLRSDLKAHAAGA